MLCDKCGVEMVPGSAFCASCGRPVSLVAEAKSTAAAVSGLSPNVAGALCYLAGAITGILFLILEPYRRDRFVRFHALQSIFFNIGWIGLYLVQAMVQPFLPWTMWRLMTSISSLVSLALLCGVVWLMYRAYNKERFKLPILGDLAEKQV